MELRKVWNIDTLCYIMWCVDSLMKLSSLILAMRDYAGVFLSLYTMNCDCQSWWFYDNVLLRQMYGYIGKVKSGNQRNYLLFFFIVLLASIGFFYSDLHCTWVKVSCLFYRHLDTRWIGKLCFFGFFCIYLCVRLTEREKESNFF